MPDIDSLIQDLRNGTEDERIAAAFGLWMKEAEIKAMWIDLGPGSVPAVQALAAALLDASAKVRSEVAHALGSLGGAAVGTVPSILDLVQAENDKGVREDAIMALESIADDSGIGSYNDQAIPVLCKILEKDSHDLRVVAATALGALMIPKPKATIEVLSRFAKSDPNDAVRAAASKAIDRLTEIGKRMGTL